MPKTREDRFLARLLDSLPALGKTPDRGTDGGPPRAGEVPEIVLGPGDDAAVVRWSGGRLLLLSTDAAEEGVHFDLRTHPLRAVGRRAVAAALSDLAAMGGQAVGTLVSLVAAPARQEAAAEAAAAAFERAQELGAPILGGNITAGARLALHVTVVGAMAPGVAPLPRSGARPGDGLFVTGALGGAALGLAVLRRCAAASTHPTPEEKPFVRRQLEPTPCLAAGALFASCGAVRAAMDISDGLALDLHRLAAASGVGAILTAARIPLAQPGSAGLTAALCGGEDYELLLAGPEAKLERAAEAGSVPLTRIGRITERADGMRLRHPDGRLEPLPSGGWDGLEEGAPAKSSGAGRGVPRR